MVPLDAETAAIEILADALPKVRTGTVVPETLADHTPYIHLARVDGRVVMPTWARGPLIDTTHLALTCWDGPDLADARTLCREAVAALVCARGRVLCGGSTLTRAVHLSGPSWLPDDHAPNGLWRFVAQTALTIH
ncbi:MAG: hypothetical protein ACRDXX_03885 [Stackebrandtia sp.]